MPIVANDPGSTEQPRMGTNGNAAGPGNSLQGRYWIVTLPEADWKPSDAVLRDGVAYIKGQLETGVANGFKHWQMVVYFRTKVRLAALKRAFGRRVHAELTRSKAAEDYCGKTETRVPGTSFEFGTKATKRCATEDWEAIWAAARRGDTDAIPPDVLIRYYGNVKRIACDHAEPAALERVVKVFWGSTGVGKSRRAWEEAGLDAYPKDPRTKFWDGYRGQERVVIDEFRGGIDVSHMLRWLDRYPVIVEVKGSSVVFKATEIWITSNLPPEKWYPDLDVETMAALKRRLKITHITNIPNPVLTLLNTMGRPIEAQQRLGYFGCMEKTWEARVLAYKFRREVLEELKNKFI